MASTAWSRGVWGSRPSTATRRVGVCQVALARRDVDLVHVLPLKFALKLDTWLTMHEDLRNSPRCKVTFEALVQGLTAYVS